MNYIAVLVVMKKIRSLSNMLKTQIHKFINKTEQQIIAFVDNYDYENLIDIKSILIDNVVGKSNIKRVTVLYTAYDNYWNGSSY